MTYCMTDCHNMATLWHTPSHTSLTNYSYVRCKLTCHRVDTHPSNLALHYCILKNHHCILDMISDISAFNRLTAWCLSLNRFNTSFCSNWRLFRPSTSEDQLAACPLSLLPPPSSSIQSSFNFTSSPSPATRCTGHGCSCVCLAYTVIMLPVRSALQVH